MLGWSPEQFWRATPAEVGAVVAVLASPPAGALDRATFDQLKEAFPDG